MIIVRFFTGVTVRYAKATDVRRMNDGSIEIGYFFDGDGWATLATVQPTAGAIVEKSDHPENEPGEVTIPKNIMQVTR